MNGILYVVFALLATATVILTDYTVQVALGCAWRELLRKLDQIRRHRDQGDL